MKEFHVYHAPRLLLFTTSEEQVANFWAENRADYIRVAVVDTETLDDVFRLTNHIDCAWWDNDGVQKVVDEARSTSVGDVICEIDDDSIKMYMVAAYGFTDITNN